MRCISLAAALVCAAGCGASSPSGGTVSTDDSSTVVTLETGCEEEASDPAVLTDAELRDSTLVLQVTQTGTGAGHTYRVCGARAVLRSYPGQWIVTVLHDAHGDTTGGTVARVLEVQIDRAAVGVTNVRERSVTVLVQ